MKKKNIISILVTLLTICMLSVSVRADATVSVTPGSLPKTDATFVVTYAGTVSAITVVTPDGRTLTGASDGAGTASVYLGEAPSGTYRLTLTGDFMTFSVSISGTTITAAPIPTQAPTPTPEPTATPTPTPLPTVAPTPTPIPTPVPVPVTTNPKETTGATTTITTATTHPAPTVSAVTTAIPTTAPPIITPIITPAIAPAIITKTPAAITPSIFTQDVSVTTSSTINEAPDDTPKPVNPSIGGASALGTIEDALKRIDPQIALLSVVAILILLAIAGVVWKKHQIRTGYLRTVLWAQRRQTKKTEKQIEAHRKKQLALPDLQELEMLKYKEKELRQIQVDQKKEQKISEKLQVERLAAEMRINRLEMQKTQREAADQQRAIDRARQKEEARIRAERDKYRREIAAKRVAAKQAKIVELQIIKQEAQRIAKEEKKTRLLELDTQNNRERELHQIENDQEKERKVAEKLQAERLTAETRINRLTIQRQQREAADQQRAIDRAKQKEEARIRAERDKHRREIEPKRVVAEKAKIEALQKAMRTAASIPTLAASVNKKKKPLADEKRKSAKACILCIS